MKDTSLGGAADVFPETAWSTILSCPDPASPARLEKLNRLIAQYWRPVYRFIRASSRAGVEDAKDLTQGFFCHILEGDFIARYQEEKGRFRHFLKGALRHFLADAHRASRRQKREGSRVVVSLDAGDLESEKMLADRGQATPDELFDVQWAREVMAAALARLRTELGAGGREAYLKVYEAYDLAPAGARPRYEDLAAQLGLAVHDVRNYLDHTRRRLHDLLLEGVTDYVTTRSEAVEEMRELFSRRVP